jgi:membrane protein implicated in regulation of membrane protease activity
MIHWIWLTGGVVLCALEALAPGMFLLWLGVAALATGLVLSLVPLDFAWSLLVFCGFAVISVIIGRKFYGSRDQESDKPFLNRPADALIGQTYVLDQPIVNGEGRVKVRDSLWRVAGPDLPAGARVKVTGVEDASLLRVEAAQA